MFCSKVDTSFVSGTGLHEPTNEREALSATGIGATTYDRLMREQARLVQEIENHESEKLALGLLYLDEKFTGEMSIDVYFISQYEISFLSLCRCLHQVLWGFKRFRTLLLHVTCLPAFA